MSFFKHGSNAFITTLIVVLGVSLLWHGAALPGFVVLGGWIFMLAEYLTHRFPLHMPPIGPEFLQKLQRRLHHDHHEQPNRLDLLFLPMWYAVPSIGVFAYAYRWLSGDWITAQALLLGSLLGLLYYEYVHYLAHVPVTPGTPWGRYMKKYHLWHHYKNEHYWFGVTNPFFDYLFGTYRRQEETDKSPSVRKLFRESD